MPPAATGLPDGFVRLTGDEVVIVADAGFLEPLEKLGLPAKGALARVLARSGGPSGRGRVAVIPLPGRSERLCLRPMRRGGWLRPLLPATFSTLARPLAELDATARLRVAGAPVPRPLLVVGERRADGGYDAALGTVYEEGTLDALHFLDSAPEQGRLLRAAAAAGAAVRHFHDAGGCHADLHVKNILLREQDDRFEAFVIDLDHARVEPRVPPRARLAEIMRLYRSLLKRGLLSRVGPRGCARFFAAYVGGDRALRRALRSGMRRERVRLAFHALHYRRARP